MERAVEESSCINEYEYIIVNDDLNTCIDTVHSVILSDKCKKANNLTFIEAIQNDLKEFKG
jgi:guanylate kinase